MSAARKLIERVADLGGRLAVEAGRVRVEAPAPLPDDLLVELREQKAEIVRELAPPVPLYDPARLQAQADRRNREAASRGETDRFCSCGRLAALAWLGDDGREVWRCIECTPTWGRA
jgi:hypothetical protein